MVLFGGISAALWAGTLTGIGAEITGGGGAEVGLDDSLWTGGKAFFSMDLKAWVEAVRRLSFDSETADTCLTGSSAPYSGDEKVQSLELL